jgi:Na+-driven multidrug efflux pump
VIARVSQTTEKTKTIHDLSTKIRLAVAIALVDSFIVGGISFFSSMLALGYGDIILNIQIALFSSLTMGGLTFFGELKKQISTARRDPK